MSDSYQPIYDAVRSRISNGDIGNAVRDVLFQQLDVSHLKAIATDEVLRIAYEHTRPSVLFRPTVTLDGDMWCALYGDNLQTGVSAFARSPDEAMRNFDAVWNQKTERHI